MFCKYLFEPTANHANRWRKVPWNRRICFVASPNARWLINRKRHLCVLQEVKPSYDVRTDALQSHGFHQLTLFKHLKMESVVKAVKKDPENEETREEGELKEHLDKQPNLSEKRGDEKPRKRYRDSDDEKDDRRRYSYID